MMSNEGLQDKWEKGHYFRNRVSEKKRSKDIRRGKRQFNKAQPFQEKVVPVY